MRKSAGPDFGAHLITATEELGKRTAAVCEAPVAAAPPRRACWGHSTAFAHSSVPRLVLRTQPRSGEFLVNPPGYNVRRRQTPAALPKRLLLDRASAIK